MQDLFDRCLKLEESQPLSENDIRKLLGGKVNVVRVLDLDKYNSVDELLYPFGQCVLLYESKLNYGHWVCITRYDNHLEFFDSYGSFPDSQIERLPKSFAKESGQDRKILSNLLLKCDYTMSYNEFPFQKHSNDVATCGKWVVLRCLLKDLILTEFRDLFFGKDSDKLASFLIGSM